MKRYNITNIYLSDAVEHSEGVWCKWEDVKQVDFEFRTMIEQLKEYCRESDEELERVKIAHRKQLSRYESMGVTSDFAEYIGQMQDKLARYREALRSIATEEVDDGNYIASVVTMRNTAQKALEEI